MVKHNIISIASRDSGVNLDYTGRAMTGILNAMAEALANGEKITIMGFGSFESHVSRPRSITTLTGLRKTTRPTVTVRLKLHQYLRNKIQEAHRCKIEKPLQDSSANSGTPGDAPTGQSQPISAS